MTIPVEFVIAVAIAVGSILGLVIRAMVAGTLHSDKLVPRKDYDALLAINASYPPQIGLAAKASTDGAQAIRDLVEMLRSERAKNGTAS